MERTESITMYLLVKKMLEEELEKLDFGSIEVRDNKYIYVHYSIDGIRRTKFVGNYSEELYTQIEINNSYAKILKDGIKEYNKKLKNLDYIKIELTEEVKRNIDYAKINLSKSIYNQAILEGVSTTLPSTENIIEGLEVSAMTPLDILKVINLKHAWEFILNENVITMNSDFSILCEINRLVEEGIHYTSGKIRNIPVRITGTRWTPDIPNEIDIKENINKILNSTSNDLDKAIELLLYVVKAQMFIDGNKRTSLIYANHYLISKGLGLLIVPSELSNKYKELLINYYENNDDKIKEFLKKECYEKI